MGSVEDVAKRVTEALVEKGLVEKAKCGDCLGVVQAVLEEVAKETKPAVAVATRPVPPELRRSNI